MLGVAARRPGVAVVAEYVGQMLLERATARHVEHLHALGRSRAPAGPPPAPPARAPARTGRGSPPRARCGGGGPRRNARDRIPGAPRDDQAADAGQQLVRRAGVGLVGDDQLGPGVRGLDGPGVGERGPGGHLRPRAGGHRLDPSRDADRGPRHETEGISLAPFGATRRASSPGTPRRRRCRRTTVPVENDRICTRSQSWLASHRPCPPASSVRALAARRAGRRSGRCRAPRRPASRPSATAAGSPSPAAVDARCSSRPR